MMAITQTCQQASAVSAPRLESSQGVDRLFTLRETTYLVELRIVLQI